MRTASWARCEMARSVWERVALQWLVAVAAIVPICAGAGGALQGPAFFGLSGSPDADSHVRYLSGLLLGIGLVFLASVHRIERHTERFLILGVIVALGGAIRLLAALSSGFPSAIIVFSLVMELGVTPALCAWQIRVARISGIA